MTPQEDNAAGADDSLAFEDACALPSPDANIPGQQLAVDALGAAISQHAEVVNEEEDRAPLPAQSSSPNFERLLNAPLPQPATSEQQLPVEPAQPQPAHASQAPGTPSEESRELVPAIFHVSEQRAPPSLLQNDAFPAMNAEAGNGMGIAARCRLPPFWRGQPKIWFFQVEAIMELNNFQDDQAEYYLIVGALDLETLTDIADFLLDPPEENKYIALKTCIEERLTDSPARQLQKVLS